MTQDLREELPQLLGELALYANHAGELAQARKFWNGLRELEPRHEATRLLAGLIAAKEGKFADAEKSYRSLLDDEPKHIAARTFLAESLIGQKRWKEAGDMLTKVLDGESEDPALGFAEALQKDLQAGNFQGQRGPGP